MDHGTEGCHPRTTLSGRFFVPRKPASTECTHSLAIALKVCSELGVPVAPPESRKPQHLPVLPRDHYRLCVGPAEPPPTKAGQIAGSEIRSWQGRKKCMKRELQSLLGQLNHAASVIGPGRTFMSDLIDHLKQATAPRHYIRLNSFAKADITWWATFMESWNGISYLPGKPSLIHMFSDASGSWGAGAVWGCHWLQLKWPSQWLSENIATKELVPIVAAIATWGQRWSGSPVCCHCDDMAIVTAINAGRARYPPCEQAIAMPVLFTAHYKLSLTAVHIPGATNIIGDAISHNYPLSPFQQLASLPVVMLPTLVRLLLDTNLHWSSPSWTPLFKWCLEKV